MMILTEYLIDVLSRLSGLVCSVALLTSLAALFSALVEIITTKSGKARLVFCVFVVFFCMVIIAVMPNKEIIRYFVAGE